MTSVEEDFPRYHYADSLSSDDRGSPIDISSLLDRLTRPSAATAKKAAPWSSPRREYERSQVTYKTYFPNPERYKRKMEKFDKKQKHYHGTWQKAEEGESMNKLVHRVAAPTHTHIKRSYDTIKRRIDVEHWKDDCDEADMGKRDTQTDRPERSPTRNRSRASTGSAKPKSTTSSASSPYLPLPPVHHHHHHGNHKDSESTTSSGSGNKGKKKTRAKTAKSGNETK